MKKLFIAICAASLLVSCDNASSQNTDDSKPVIVETIMSPSGVEIQVLKKGEGRMPEQGNKLVVHYTGYLKISGDTFDSSVKRGQPFKFQVGVGQVIPGWDEGMMMLPVGTKALLNIPSSLAYGAQEIPGIPANSDLVFEVEILDAIEGPKPIQHSVWETTNLEKHTTNTGLEYYIIEEGNGPMVQPGKTLQVHYYGYLEDGNKFDESFARGEPLEFVYMQQQMIPGFDEGLGLLTEGTKAKLVIPYMLAYGENGRPPVIPAKATLIFDIEILSVK